MKTAVICIATYRREEGVVRLLKALRSQRAPAGWRVLCRVVNNDPEADMVRFRRVVAAADPDACVTQERRRNIASARNAAVNKGRAEAYLFIDDDELPCEGWLGALLERIDRGDADAVFGPVVGRPVPGTAPWLVRAGVFDKPGPAHDGAIPWTGTRTSSTAVAGAWFCERGFRFDEGFGRSGGSDVELFRRMQEAGARFVHERRALVYEDVEGDRCEWRAVLRRRYRAGVVLGKMERGRGLAIRSATACKRVLHGLALTGAGLVPLLVGRPATLFRGACRVAVGTGAWRGHNERYTVTRYPERAAKPMGGASACV